jgi:hypothetical protein
VDPQPDYSSAVNVGGLDAARRVRLLEHLAHASTPVSLAVARCAATLLAADPQRRFSAPTALAQAEILAEAPEAGPALMQLYDTVMTLTRLARQDGWGGGLYRSSLRQALSYLVGEMQSMIARLGD